MKENLWQLVNLEELPKNQKGQIDRKNCIGITLKFKLKSNENIYEIKILDYIGQCKKNGNHPQFKVKYTYLKGTKYEEDIEKIIYCHGLINKYQLGEIVPSLNQWIKKDEYWIGVDTKGREFKFSTNNKKTEYNILHSTWSVANNKRKEYVSTSNLNYTGERWTMHRAIYFRCNIKESKKYNEKIIDHKNGDELDNRISNLRLVTKIENNKNKNTKNKYGLTGLNFGGKGYYSTFIYEGHHVSTKTKYDLEEAKIDNLIGQKHLGYKHNEDQFYKLEELPKERIKEVTDLLDKKIEKNKHKAKKEKEYAYEYIKKDNIIGIKTFKKDGTPNEICWVDEDFGRVEGDRFIVKNNIRCFTKNYFNYKDKSIHRYIMLKYLPHYYRSYRLEIDHINHKPNQNYRDNLEIVTIKSNLMNKESKGYTIERRKSEIKYRVHYAYNWKYFNSYIKGLNMPTFNTEEEAITEVKRRKEIVDKYRFRIGWQGSVEANIKVLDEVINFAEEHELDLDSAYIVWRGLDTMENIKNFLKAIDK